jgi:hypothetical protein
MSMNQSAKDSVLGKYMFRGAAFAQKEAQQWRTHPKI